jgi:hypothetical protein
MLGECHRALRLGPVCQAMMRTALMLAAADLQPQPHRPRQRHQGPAVLVAQSHVAAATRAVLPEGNQHPLPRGFRPRQQPGHVAPPELVKEPPAQRITPVNFASLEKLGTQRAQPSNCKSRVHWPNRRHWASVMSLRFGTSGLHWKQSAHCSSASLRNFAAPERMASSFRPASRRDCRAREPAWCFLPPRPDRQLPHKRQ